MKNFSFMMGVLVLIVFSACSGKSDSDNPQNNEPVTDKPKDDKPDVNEPFTGIPDNLVIKKEVFVAHDVHLVTEINTPKTVTLSDERRSTYTLTSQPVHGTITGTMPTLTYTPAQDYHGDDSLTYVKTKGDKTDTATIMIHVYSENADTNDINMTLDLNQSSLQVNWTTLANTQATKATVVSQGNFGSFSIEGNQLTYTKTRESKEIDTAVLALEQDGVTKEILVNVEALYWKQVAGTIAIKSDGTLWSGGVVQETSHATNWKQATTGHRFQCGIKEDGTLWNFIYDNDTNTYMVAQQEPTMATNWKSVKSGYNHMIALKTDGTIWSHASYSGGALGDGEEASHHNSDAYWFQEFTQATDWVFVDAGSDFSMAIKSDGTLWGWGRNDAGQAGDGTKIAKNQPIQEATHAINWKSVSLGNIHSVALQTDGTLWSWGKSFMVKDKNGTFESLTSPTQEPTFSTDWEKVSAGTSYTTALKKNGTLWSWGYNGYGQFGNTTSSLIQKELVQEATQSNRWIDIYASSFSTLAIKEDGSLWGWGQIYKGAQKTIKNAKQEVTKSNNWKSVSVGSGYTIAIKEDGTLWSWGTNFSGQLGNGNNVKQAYPVQESTHANNWKSAITTANHTMAIKEDGTLWYWGELNKERIKNPVQESSHATNWERFIDKTVIKSDKSIWTLDSKNSEKSSPLLVERSTPILDWKEVYLPSGARHAIKEDGTLWSWGNNAGYGMFGTGDTKSSDTPVQESTQSHNWAKIYRGTYHVLALKDDGTLWGWGANFSGQLGDGTKTDNYTPTEEKSLSIWTDVMTSYNDSVGLRVDGTIWTWGGARYSDDETLLLPKQEPSHSDAWKTLAVGTYGGYIMAIKKDGTLWGWGNNGSSQIYPLYYAPQRTQKRVP